MPTSAPTNTVVVNRKLTPAACVGLVTFVPVIVSSYVFETVHLTLPPFPTRRSSDLPLPEPPVVHCRFVSDHPVVEPSVIVFDPVASDPLNVNVRDAEIGRAHV